MPKNYKVTVKMVTNEIASTESLENSKTIIEENLYKKADTSLSNLDATGQAKFDAKANIDLSNLNNTGNVAASNLNTKGIRTVIETYKNGNHWYRVWSDGWIEQGGYADNNGAAYSEQVYSIYWAKPFSDDKYTFLQCQNSADFTAGAFYMRWTQAVNKTANSIQIWSISLGGVEANSGAKMYYACGY